MKIKTKNLIIFGTTGGIGSQLARELTHSGDAVIITGRNEDKLAELSAEMNAPFRVVDAADADQAERCIADTKNEYGF